MTDSSPLDDRLERIGETIARRQREREHDDEQPPSTLLADVHDLPAADDRVRRAAIDERRRRWSEVVDDRFAEARLDDVHDSSIVEPLRQWSVEPVNLLLFGPVGTGKSHAAAAAAFETWMRGYDVECWEVPVLLDEIDWRAPDAALVVRTVSRCDVLLLDDLGADPLSEWARGRVTRVVTERWRRDLPTIVTTNLEPDGLADAVGERVYSRLADDAVAVKVTGPDRRRVRRGS